MKRGLREGILIVLLTNLRNYVQNTTFLDAGAREAYIVKEPILAALGAGIPINSPSGNMIINIGGGTSEVAVVSLGGIVSWSSLRVAGNKFDQAITDYVKKKYAISIGEQMAEARAFAVPYVLIMGHKEATEGTVLVREVATNSQDAIPLPELINYLKRHRVVALV